MPRSEPVPVESPQSGPSKGGIAGERPPRLTLCELEIMDILWKRGEGTVQDVCDGLTRPLAYTSVSTMLVILESRKRVLQRTKRGRAYVYRPIVSRGAVSKAMMGDLKTVLFEGSVRNLVLHLISDEAVSPDEVARLMDALKTLEQGNDGSATSGSGHRTLPADGDRRAGDGSDVAMHEEGSHP